MKIGVACDHAGFEHKEKLKECLSSKGYKISEYKKVQFNNNITTFS